MKVIKNFCARMFYVILMLGFIFFNLRFDTIAAAYHNGKNNVRDDASELRGIWITFADLKPILYLKTESEFTSNINNMFNNIKSLNLTDIIVHVRPFADAIYKSNIFPASYLLKGKQGIDCDYDPLRIMVEKAHEKGLKIHAWVNPYRISMCGSNNLADNHIAKKWIDNNDTNEIIKLDNGLIYFNPCSFNARKLIIDGVKEIITNYNVDGIHLDDYFYPSTDSAIDNNAYKQYITEGGTLSLNDWRLNNVNLLIKGIYSAIKSLNPSVLFGISPDGNISRNYDVHYADVKRWMSEVGYIDYICPQIYYGFNHQTYPFDKVLNDWIDLLALDTVDLFAGLSVYKIGNIDKFAGSGQNEWIDHDDVISRQIKNCQSNNKCSGFVLYKYESLFNSADRLHCSLINKVMSDIRTLLKG